MSLAWRSSDLKFDVQVGTAACDGCFAGENFRQTEILSLTEILTGKMTKNAGCRFLLK